MAAATRNLASVDPLFSFVVLCPPPPSSLHPLAQLQDQLHRVQPCRPPQPLLAGGGRRRHGRTSGPVVAHRVRASHRLSLIAPCLLCSLCFLPHRRRSLKRRRLSSAASLRMYVGLGAPLRTSGPTKPAASSSHSPTPPLVSRRSSSPTPTRGFRRGTSWPLR